MIMSLLTTGLIIVIALASVAILWDSGLRWNSALKQLQRQLKELDEPAMKLRPQTSGRFGKASVTYSFTKSVKRPAAA